MFSNYWLIVLGIILLITELLFGVATGFDLALIGLAFIFGGVIQYYSATWQYGVSTAIAIIIFYLFFLRKTIRKKLLINTQKIGIDSLIGKEAVVISKIRPQQPGKVLLDGEVWRAMAGQEIAEEEKVWVEKIEGASLKVVSKNNE